MCSSLFNLTIKRYAFLSCELSKIREFYHKIYYGAFSSYSVAYLYITKCFFMHIVCYVMVCFDN